MWLNVSKKNAKIPLFPVIGRQLKATLSAFMVFLVISHSLVPLRSPQTARVTPFGLTTETPGSSGHSVLAQLG